MVSIPLSTGKINPIPRFFEKNQKVRLHLPGIKKKESEERQKSRCFITKKLDNPFCVGYH